MNTLEDDLYNVLIGYELHLSDENIHKLVLYAIKLGLLADIEALSTTISVQLKESRDLKCALEAHINSIKRGLDKI